VERVHPLVHRVNHAPGGSTRPEDGDASVESCYQPYFWTRFLGSDLHIEKDEGNSFEGSPEEEAHRSISIVSGGERRSFINLGGLT
jgi:hypothetical protein